MTRVTDQITVLNVDDYEPGRYSRSRVLRNAGFAVVEAGTGGEALRVVRSARPHLVLLDVNLPDMSGLEVCRQIKSDPELEQTLVLHVSATSVTTDSKVRALIAGADSYLAEPVDPDELVANVNALLRLKRAEEQLRQTNATLQAIVSSTPVAIVTLDHDGVVRRWNVAAETIFGWSADEVLGRSLPIAPDEAPAFAESLSRAASDGVSSSFDALVRRRDGTAIDVLVSVAPLRDGRGQIDGVLAVVDDISERKRSEREVARLYAESQAANRSKDEFLATLSHELRTPLNAMLGWVRLLRTGSLPEARRKHALEVVERNTLAQMRLIEDILDVSRIVSGKLQLRSQPVDLAHIVESAADTIRPTAEAAGIQLRVRIESPSGSDALRTAGDLQRIHQVVSNLLSNALKFTPPGGRIDVTLRRVQDSGEITVRDSGVGIDPALLPFVFDRFRQGDSGTARAHGGLGLGLAIVRHLVQAHGGHVTAASAGPGQGSTFIAAFPIVPVPVQSDPSAELSAPGWMSLAGLSVLVVEDDADSRTLIETLLLARGADVTTAGSAEQALRVLGERVFDVLVADIGLPVVDGFNLLRSVRSIAALEDLPAIAVTGFASEEDRLRVTAAGYAAHLPKPVDADALATTIARLAPAAKRPPLE
jgi:PAS domain S-box-containing protein